MAGLLAGLARHYPRSTSVVHQGVESQGMLLGADCGTIPALLTVDTRSNRSAVQ